MTRKFRLTSVAVILVSLGAAAPARAEFNLTIFTGVALTQDNDLDLHQTGGTDLTFHDVSYEGRDFETPPFYGARALWFPSESAHWGFGAEFFHIKLYAQTDETVRVTGERGGLGVDDNERIDNTLQQFSLSHGLNYALADVVYRFFPGTRGPGFPNCLQPYVGLGIGAAIPHVESNVGGLFHEEYQLHGPGVQGLVGVNVDLTRHWGVMFEYKVTYANLDSLEIPNGSIELTPITHNLVAGITLRF
ncbi:MAG: porin family protein [Verrucomicrobiota bacterium]|nr:porin family protein [Verrucomicrobiota bacterium]